MSHVQKGRLQESLTQHTEEAAELKVSLISVFALGSRSPRGLLRALLLAALMWLLGNFLCR